MDNPLVFVVAGMLPYVTAVVFLSGVISMMVKWSRVRVPFKITVTPAPSNLVVDIASEALFFKTLFSGARSLWAGGWIFHACLAMALVGHVFGIAVLARQFMLLGASASQSEQLSAFLGGAAGVGMLVALLYLLYRRSSNSEVKAISDASDYLVLLLVISIVVTGNYMRFFMHVDLASIRDYLGSVAAFKPVAPPNAMFLVHIFFVQLLLLYFPFSKLMHSCGLFFTRWLMGKRDLVSPKEAQA